MSYVNKMSLDSLLQSVQAQTLKRETLQMLLRSVLEAIVEENTNSLLLFNIINPHGIESIIRRLEYCQNVSMHSFNRVGAEVQKNFQNAEFVLAVSQRFSVVIVWSNKFSHEADIFQVYTLMNSKNIDDIYEVINKNGNKKIDEEYYAFKPERRSNRILNNIINKTIKSLNDLVVENQIKDEAEKEILSRDISQKFREQNYQNIRECCHEMKNHFSVIDVYTQILKKQFGENKNIDVIAKSIISVNKLLGELRDFRDYDLGKIGFRETISNVCEIMKPSMEERNNVITIDFGNVLNEEIFVDKEKFSNVIINVLKNANEFTENDKIEVRLNINSKTAEVLIINHGAKIEEKDAQNIFKNGFTTKQDGWGIGLNIAKTDMENMAGSIELIKSDDNSTEFLIKAQLGM